MGSSVITRIVLVRHGPSAHTRPNGLIDRAEVQKWRDSYDSAGIVGTGTPPAALVTLASEASHVIASDLRRAVQSAEQLAPGRELLVSKLLRESPLAVPSWPTRLPFVAWGALIHLRWSYEMLRGIDEAEPDRDRARAAADWLSGIVASGQTAVVVTHGVFRRMLAQQLVASGWASVSRHGGYSHWSTWHLIQSIFDPPSNTRPT